MGGLRVDSEIPLLWSFFCLFSEAVRTSVKPMNDFGLKPAALHRRRTVLKTVSGGEFDWGGTSVKE